MLPGGLADVIASAADAAEAVLGAAAAGPTTVICFSIVSPLSSAGPAGNALLLSRCATRSVACGLVSVPGLVAGIVFSILLARSISGRLSHARRKSAPASGGPNPTAASAPWHGAHCPS